MRRLSVVLTGLIVAAAILLVWLVTQPVQAAVEPKVGNDGTYVVGTVPRGQDAVEVAVEVLPAALSFDYRRLNDERKVVDERMTESFGREFRATFDKTAGRMAKKERAVSRAVVRGAGLVEANGDRATCLVFLDQLSIAAQAAKDKAPVAVSKSRVLVKLVHEDGAWKVDGIDPF
jgi:hypothetical protein